jgi:hypothetical protein
MFHVLFAERKAHPPLVATPEGYNRVEVVVTKNHLNRTAPSGWMVRLVLPDAECEQGDECESGFIDLFLPDRIDPASQFSSSFLDSHCASIPAAVP